MDCNILDGLERTAHRVPARIAFYDDHSTLTFSGLVEAARRIGSAVAALAAPRSAVALLLDARSIRNLPALFGVLYAGCAYAPMDISQPVQRLHQLLRLLNPAVVVADEKGRRALEGLDIPVLAYEQALSHPVDAPHLAAIRRGASVYDPLSILYTSGSTGVPKGSVQTHFAYLHWTQATVDAYGFDENAVFGNQSPFFYANSIIDIFPPVMLGATVYLLPAGVLTFPKKLIDCLNAHHVTELTMTPSSFIGAVSAGVLEPGCLPELRYGIMSGESMPWAPLQAWMQATPNASWWHFYGSTEMFSVAVGKVTEPPKAGERLPVGKPFPLTHILFTDENGVEVPAGTPGEMLLSSPWVSVGYYRDTARTESAWVVDPLGQGLYERFYRGGDIGYLRPDGQLIVLGRRDSQIKHMGYRMELGEVEAALGTIPGWEEGCVLWNNETLYCCYTGSLSEKTIQKELKSRLARYMLPDVYVHLEALPRTPTMKLNRSALLAQLPEVTKAEDK